jgi:alkaline phosphatase D
MSTGNVLQKISRRKFLRNSVIAASGVILLPSALTSCKKEQINDEAVSIGQGFNEGVASFDPSQDKVILWTRYTPASGEIGKPTILLDVAKDKDFKTLVVSQSVQVDNNSDNTVHVDVSNLTSNTKYFYRFRSETAEVVSAIGETKTLPAAGQVSDVKMAVVSCADFQTGLFNVYGAVAESDADFVVHLGNYIYEFGVLEYGSNLTTIPLKREHKPEGRTIRIEDYRERYRQYRGDEHLQKAHQLKPFICVWDEHDVSQNAYKDGAENPDPAEGDWNTHKMVAIQAWHEYLPCRVADNARIYRNFEIAGFVNLMMLDTRLVGRDKQINYLDYTTQTGLNTSAFLAALQNPQRTMLGQEQRSWLDGKLKGSTCKWQVLGSPVLMGKIYFPAELLPMIEQFATGYVNAVFLAQFNIAIAELVVIKTRVLQNDPTLTAAEKARVDTVLPYDLDLWDGYPAEREKIYAAATGKKLISLAGNSNDGWYSDLTSNNGRRAGVEFAGSSVNASGFERYFLSDPVTIAGFEQALPLLITDLQYIDASRRGYVFASFTADQVKSEWRYVATIALKDTATVTGKTATES